MNKCHCLDLVLQQVFHDIPGCGGQVEHQLLAEILVCVSFHMYH